MGLSPPVCSVSEPLSRRVFLTLLIFYDLNPGDPPPLPPKTKLLHCSGPLLSLPRRQGWGAMDMMGNGRGVG